LLYILFTVPATRIENAIELAGIRTAGKLYIWEDIINFWVAEREGRTVFYFTTRLNFPARIIVLADSFDDTQKIVNNSVQFVPYMPLIQEQGIFEKQFDGEYVDPSTFFRRVSIQDVIAQEATSDNKTNSKADQNDETSVPKTRSNKATT
jgi:hypothetical protein